MALLSEKQAALYLDVSIWTLREWRRKRKGPAFIRLNAKQLRYHVKELDRFIEERTVKYEYDPTEDESDNQYLS